MISLAGHPLPYLVAQDTTTTVPGSAASATAASPGPRRSPPRPHRLLHPAPGSSSILASPASAEYVFPDVGEVDPQISYGRVPQRDDVGVGDLVTLLR